ncbi:hypothetical protein [Segatella copri]|uniref:Uncharacterized protein n=1 Tax=Segatella copri DSM 18205 TaxID=537011 RepID=D1PBL8_9BACT|nr:hypothetical protein [Segatella copri]EFB35694.1 hypothetical protein PREVCOP_04598 [Segatella copri DSM 18205]MCW4096229.1 hypothetical protein [Segatella copri]MQP19721.1 hypothetical protein [Segatella copri DSM 18205]UEA44238.1 hypothetical protein LK433_06735 [Segatella copri DSM 18205]UWP51143.1 hypothetical protein NQ544_07285 [Segatella copri DSM 18205]
MTETQHVIALNPYRKGNKGKVFSNSMAVYDKVIASPEIRKMIQQIRGELPIPKVNANDAEAVKKAQDRLKSELPFFCPHYGIFKNNVRRQENAQPESFMFQTIIDVDDREYVDKAIEKARELNCSDSIWNGSLLHLCYSARKKLHIGIRLPVGMTIEETQKAYCEALGVPYDESCITPERMIYLTDKDSEIYRSKMWCAVLSEKEILMRRQAYLDRGLTVDGRGKVNSLQLKVNSNGKNNENNRLSGHDGNTAVSAGSAVQPAQPGDSHGADAPHIGDSGGNQNAGGLEAREKNLIAFDLFTQAAGLGGMEIDTVGSRHSSLLAIMSAGASRVMEEEELMKVVRVKMPSYYQENDCHQLIHDFYAKYADNTKPMSREVMRVNALAEQKASQQVNSLQLTGNRAKQQVNSLQLTGNRADEDYPDPPEMPKKLPKLVELLISRTPEIYKPAVAHAIFPPLATHLWKTRFRYIDNVEHEARLMTLLLAGTGAGKSSVNRPIDFIMEDIRLRDAENLKREKAWKDEMLRKGANKDKRKRPENLIIQEIDADMTNPAFVMRTAEAQEHFLYTSLNELDQFDALKGSGNQQFRIMCLAADPGNKYGQTRVGTMSITERVTIRFNWNASTTIQKGQRYFSKVLTDGPISRINFCTIPEREIGEDMPVYGTYDESYREALRPYIENLNKVTGLIECKEAFQLALKLKDENAEFARLSQDRTFENLSFRANVIAYLKACVLYVANGCKWEPEIDEFIRWSEQYDLYCKMRFFGDMIAKENFMAEKSSKRGPQNLLQILPDNFTAAQLLAIRLEHGLDAKGTDMMIRQWLHRKYIRRAYQYTGKRDSCDSCDSFEKLKYRHDGMVIES